MRLITPLQAARLAKRASHSTNRRIMLREFAISNRNIAFFNPITTIELDRTVDNRRDNVPQTEDEVIESVLFGHVNRFKANKNDATSDNTAFASFLLNKISQAKIANAHAKQESKHEVKSVHDIFVLDRSTRDFYAWRGID